ncbi:hypothetical protein QLQ12_42925 [Actinoplanes sp. NEAU-A12]|uniref:Uncharacterized protein n=1 Tax=Actinoplanes sandaracinus TaxID=3045177 RepID=A0ABT6X019_9ACTN|nr:hypothetical protein [Actinoplanes sandaracinus]MDI6105356.1 hypothetical protein [Actinoplanes sandaracinus]
MNGKRKSRGFKVRLRLAAVLAVAAGFVAGAASLSAPAHAGDDGTGCCIHLPHQPN